MKIVDFFVGSGLRATMLIAGGFLAFHAWAEIRVANGEPRLFHQRLELMALDLKLETRGAKPPDRWRVAIAAFDEKAIDRYGPQPWSRSLHASLVDALTALDAGAIAFDLTHEKASMNATPAMLGRCRSEAEKSGILLGPEIIEGAQRTLGRSASRLERYARWRREGAILRETAESVGPVRTSIRRFKEAMDRCAAEDDPDALFTKALQASGRSVLGILALSEPEANLLDLSLEDARASIHQIATSTISQFVAVSRSGHQEEILSGKKSFRLGPYRNFFGLVLPYAPFAHAAGGFGTINALPDEDGTFRRMPLVATIKDSGVLIPTLSLEASRVVLDEMPEILGHASGHVPESLRLGTNLFSLGVQASTLIDWYGRFYGGPMPVFSVVDILEKKVTREDIAGRAIFVAPTALGTFDQRVTPLEDSVPGVYIHATLAQNLLDGRQLERPQYIIVVEALLILLIGLVSGLVMSRANIFALVASTIILAVGWVAVDQLVFFRNGIVVFAVFPVAQVFVTSLAAALLRFVSEQRERRKTRHAFGQYLSRAVLEQVLSDPQEYLRLGGRRYDATVLFSDIRGFTTISESLSPEELGALLNRYMTPMTDIVLAHQGTLDKYIGDAVMAFWGAPIPNPDHAALACQASLEMQETVARLNVDLERDGLPRIDIGIGLSTGPMTIGNMGSDAHFSYTALGDRVNLGARLEGQTKLYGVGILISEETHQRIHDRYLCRQLGAIRVKGRVEPVLVYELLGPQASSAALKPWVEMFHRGIELFRSRAWDDAAAAFEAARGMAGDREDRASSLYLGWCAAYKASPPPPDWAGVYEATTK
ncbi:MAG: adenylate/guanylate cyclase domain-containing protein [Deltaproteobacteria bacterium]|nr:adenylate/guanylate cyclase domain-containing protein [Deltaproteobacteria bacterium]